MSEILNSHSVEDLEMLLKDSLLKPRLVDLPRLTKALKRMRSGIDDRKLLLEKILVLMSALGDESPFSNGLQQFIIRLLYKDLPHPPSGYLRVPTPGRLIQPLIVEKKVNYAFRTPDGSDYNVLHPFLGKAGMPYARSVPSMNYTPPASLPDPGLLFDTLLRREKFTAHPGGISSLFFAFANLIIHSIFHTDLTDWTSNKASSYLDLSILYGSSQGQVDQVRRKDGTGRLWDDVFTDSRLLFMPPPTCALLVLLSRNHNYIAEKILNINERGTYSSPPPADEAARLAQDDEIFHRARLVNCGFFMQIILRDYVGAILGLTRDGSTWRLDPLQAMREFSHEVSPRGEGNVVSIEFNILYRWHATLSMEDTQWTENLFKKIFEGKDFDKITVEDFKEAAHKYMIPPKDVKSWTFGDLTRGPDGRFADDDLAKILLNATECSASAFTARGSPEALRVVEILGIEQSRAWGTCSLNEFRRFMGLKPYSSFKEWNPDEKIHTTAAALYRDIENLELHVGLQAEETKVPGPGAGLCPGYTISRAILGDAVCLTRGDRFLTVDFTPSNVTSWGFQDCQPDKDDGSYGGMLTKLLFRTLPNHYPVGSAYAHFPFLVPSFMKKIMEDSPDRPVDRYTWERPPVPKGIVVVDTYKSVAKVLEEQSKFVAEHDHRVYALTKGVILDRKLVNNVLFSEDRKWADFFARTTTGLIKARSAKRVNSPAHYVDIVKDVINMLPIHWIAHEIAGLPLKALDSPDSPDSPDKPFEEQQLHEMFSDVCRYVFLNFDPVQDWRLRETSVHTFTKLVEFVIAELDNLSGVGHHASTINDHSKEFLRRLLSVQGELTRKELATTLFAETIPTAAHFSQALAHIVDFFIGGERSHAREDIVRLAALHTKDGDAQIMGYVREALRLNPPVFGVYRIAAVGSYVEGTKIQTDDHVFASIVKANLDIKVFGPEPKQAVYDRPKKMAGILGLGEYGLLSSRFFEATVPRILGKVLRLKGLHRGPGTSGIFNKFSEDRHGTPRQLYIDSRGHITPFPDSLVIQYTELR